MNFINSLSPDAGPITSLVVAFLSAVMDVITAFNVFHFSGTQQTAIITVATASIALGLYIFAILHQQSVNLKLSHPALFAKQVSGNTRVVPDEQMREKGY